MLTSRFQGKANHPPLTGKWTQSFRFYTHVLRPSEDRMAEACYTYDHGKAIKMGLDEDHVSSIDIVTSFRRKLDFDFKKLATLMITKKTLGYFQMRTM